MRDGHGFELMKLPACVIQVNFPLRFDVFSFSDDETCHIFGDAKEFDDPLGEPENSLIKERQLNFILF